MKKKLFKFVLENNSFRLNGQYRSLKGKKNIKLKSIDRSETDEVRFGRILIVWDKASKFNKNLGITSRINGTEKVGYRFNV